MSKYLIIPKLVVLDTQVLEQKRIGSEQQSRLMKELPEPYRKMQTFEDPMIGWRFVSIFESINARNRRGVRANDLLQNK
jgi:hypothetical protein